MTTNPATPPEGERERLIEHIGHHEDCASWQREVDSACNCAAPTIADSILADGYRRPAPTQGGVEALGDTATKLRDAIFTHLFGPDPLVAGQIVRRDKGAVLALINTALVAQRATSEARVKYLEGEVDYCSTHWKSAEAAIATAREDALKRAEEIALQYASVNLEMAGDTILLDPVLRGKRDPQSFARSEDLMIEGAMGSASYHTAKFIASAIAAERGGNG